MTNFNWTKQRLQAAELVARDVLSDEKIAKTVGVTRQSLARWKNEPVFQERVREYIDIWNEEIKTTGIASRLERVAAMNDRWERMKTMLDDRADHYKDSNVPGARTGLIYEDPKSIGVGANNQIVTQYLVDGVLLSEMRALEKQAAQELGQWTERSDVNIGIESEIERLARENDMPEDEVRAMVDRFRDSNK